MKVVSLSLFFGRAFGLSACCLLILAHGNLLGRAGAKGTPRPSNVIRVWTVGSPFRGDLPPAIVPPALQRQAESLGYTIEVQTFQAVGFAAKFRQAIQEHNEPEVLTFDNYGVVWGITTSTGRIEGVGADDKTGSTFVWVHESLASLQQRGWVLLVRSAANYEAARQLTMQPPVCGAEFGPAAQLSTTPELQQAQETATTAARSYLACDRSSLSALSDESRLGRNCYLPESDSQVEQVKACSVIGNHNLAFVSLVSAFVAQARVLPLHPRNYPLPMPSMDLGHQSLLAILRNQGGVWRLVAISDDPINTDEATYLTTRRFGRLLNDGIPEPVALEPGQLITAEGIYPRPEQGQRFGDFVWRPGQNAVCEVAEFLVGDRASLRERTRLFFLFRNEGRISSGLLWGDGARWRVWSVSRNGDIAFSEQHSFRR